MCAQIVAPYPPPGRISVASQSGNLVSSLPELRVPRRASASRKAISCGQLRAARARRLPRVLRRRSGDGGGARLSRGRAATGARFAAPMRAPHRAQAARAREGRRRPPRASARRASHTGSLASDDRVFDGVCRQVGRAARADASRRPSSGRPRFATQPLPRGRRVVVFTTAGGWGVLAADACAAAGLELIALPEDLRARSTRWCRARWSRSNPIDLAGGETRDTIPEVLDLICAHPDVDAVIHLGIGIQAAQAQAVPHAARSSRATGSSASSSSTSARTAATREAAREASERHGKPVLIATELVYTDRAYGNAGPARRPRGGAALLPERAPRRRGAARAGRLRGVRATRRATGRCTPARPCS